MLKGNVLFQAILKLIQVRITHEKRPTFLEQMNVQLWIPLEPLYRGHRTHAQPQPPKKDRFFWGHSLDENGRNFQSFFSQWQFFWQSVADLQEEPPAPALSQNPEVDRDEFVDF